MKQNRITYALYNVVIFMSIMILIDVFFYSESFEKNNYWKIQLTVAAILFCMYLIVYQFKDLTWKDMFSKKKKSNFKKQ